MNRLPKELAAAGPFLYTCVERLREEGLPDSVSDARALDLIYEAGDIITALTGCPFVPITTAVRVDGRGDALLYLPSLVPIIEVTAIDHIEKLEEGDDEITPYTADMYVVKERWIEANRPQASRYRDTMSEYRMWTGLNGYQFVWPECDLGLRITGTFGWIERARTTPTTLVVATQADPGDESVDVDDLLDVEVGDVVLLPGGTVRKLVTGVDETSKTICFVGQPLRAVLALDAELKVWGAVPRLLRKAATLIVMANYEKLGSDARRYARRADRIQSESTDGYSYSLGGDLFIGGDSLTNSEEAEAILAEFMPPPIVQTV